jgi:hypothetical protein
MIVVHVEAARNLIAQYRALQELNVHEVELWENGEKVDVPQQFKDDWKFCGMGFAGFIEYDFYKTGFVDENGNPAPPLPKESDDGNGTQTTGG